MAQWLWELQHSVVEDGLYFVHTHLWLRHSYLRGAVYFNHSLHGDNREVSHITLLFFLLLALIKEF